MSVLAEPDRYRKIVMSYFFSSEIVFQVKPEGGKDSTTRKQDRHFKLWPVAKSFTSQLVR